MDERGGEGGWPIGEPELLPWEHVTPIRLWIVTSDTAAAPAMLVNNSLTSDIDIIPGAQEAVSAAASC